MQDNIAQHLITHEQFVVLNALDPITEKKNTLIRVMYRIVQQLLNNLKAILLILMVAWETEETAGLVPR